MLIVLAATQLHVYMTTCVYCTDLVGGRTCRRLDIAQKADAKSVDIRLRSTSFKPNSIRALAGLRGPSSAAEGVLSGPKQRLPLLHLLDSP